MKKQDGPIHLKNKNKSLKKNPVTVPTLTLLQQY